MRVVLSLRPQFQWREGTHGASLRWHIWVEDSEGQHLYHNELWGLTRKMMAEAEHRIAFTIPIFEPLPSQYYIRCVCGRASVAHVSARLCANAHASICTYWCTHTLAECTTSLLVDPTYQNWMFQTQAALHSNSVFSKAYGSALWQLEHTSTSTSFHPLQGLSGPLLNKWNLLRS